MSYIYNKRKMQNKLMIKVIIIRAYLKGGIDI